jgi:hypothetical protein
MDVGVYVIQEACMIAQEAAPVAVTAREIPKTRPDFFDEVEETIEFTMEYANGLRAEGRASYTERYNRFRAEAADGWLEMEPQRVILRIHQGIFQTLGRAYHETGLVRLMLLYSEIRGRALAQIFRFAHIDDLFICTDEFVHPGQVRNGFCDMLVICGFHAMNSCKVKARELAGFGHFS